MIAVLETQAMVASIHLHKMTLGMAVQGKRMPGVVHFASAHIHMYVYVAIRISSFHYSNSTVWCAHSVYCLYCGCRNVRTMFTVAITAMQSPNQYSI